MRRTFDFAETIINPSARGQIHRITDREVPDAGKVNRLEMSPIQGWSLDPISGTTARLGPEQNPDATRTFPYGRNVGNFPEKGQVPSILSVPIFSRVFDPRPKPKEEKSGGCASRFVNVYITTPECEVASRGVYSGKHVNGDN